MDEVQASLQRGPIRLARRSVLAAALLTPTLTAAGGKSQPALLPAYVVEGRPAVRWSLAERMANYHTPGVSIAVFEAGALAWAQGFGVQVTGGAAPVGPRTLFQAASISKVVAATAAL